MTDQEIIEKQKEQVEDFEYRLKEQEAAIVKEELKEAKKEIADYKRVLEKKNDHVSQLRQRVLKLEKEKEQYFDTLDKMLEMQRYIKDLKLQIDDLKGDKEDLQWELDRVRNTSKRKHNEREAGRKRDKHLDVYLLGCWAKEMTDQEIIGSEYDGFNGKKKVARASYYRAKKRLIGQHDEQK